MKTTITEASWNSEGERLFGADRMKWRFRCPACGHVATPEDFRKFKDKGANPNSATQECIGRYFPMDKRGGFSSDHANPKVKQPCDYAGYGLIHLSPVEIEREGVENTDCFAFDDGAGVDATAEKAAECSA